MCNAHVTHTVRERIKKEGLPSVSRRSFLKAGSILAAGAALAPQVARADMHGGSEVVDLSHVMSPDFPVFPGVVTPGARKTVAVIEENIIYMQRWEYDEHQGTHMDFPAHVIPSATRVDAFSAAGLVGPAVVIDIAARAQDDPRYRSHGRRFASLGDGEWGNPRGRFCDDALRLGSIAGQSSFPWR